MTEITPEPTAYDLALSELLDDGGNADLRERLASGTATDEDRATARDALGEPEKRRFELAYPIAPAHSALEVEVEELAIPIEAVAKAKTWKDHSSTIRERLRDVADEAPPEAEITVRVPIRLVRES